MNKTRFEKEEEDDSEPGEPRGPLHFKEGFERRGGREKSLNDRRRTEEED